MLQSGSKSTRKQIGKALETLVSCTVFGIPLYASAAGIGWPWFLELGLPALGLVLAMVMSAVVWGMPSYELSWKVQGRSPLSECNAFLKESISSKGTWELEVELELLTSCYSIASEYAIRRLVNNGGVLKVEVLPVELARDIREDSSRGRAGVQRCEIAGVWRQFLILPLTDSSNKGPQHKSSHSKLCFSLLFDNPGLVGDLVFDATLQVSKRKILKNRPIVAIGGDQKIRLDGVHGNGT